MNNSAQSELWNGRLGTGWASVEDYIDRMLGPISEAGITAAATQADEKVLDIGCGCGTTTLQLAASGASVWGVDISAPMIEQAQAKPADGLTVQFSVGDAATTDYTPEHDCVFSRFGVMFFSDPVAAFKNIRSALKADGRLVFLCWQAPALNPWVSQVGQVLQPFMPPDAPRPEPTDPGPFAFADEARTKGILEGAGFIDIQHHSLEKPLPLGGGLEELMAFQREVGPLSGVLASADDETAAKATAAVEAVFTPYITDDVTDKGIEMTAASLAGDC